MNIEQRLQAASRELNQVSRRTAPPPLATERTIGGGLLAFSAAFAVVIAVMGIPLLLSNLGQSPTDGGPLGSAATTITTALTTTPGSECSAADVGYPTTMAYSDSNDGSDPRDLTEPVADKVFRIATAARECDYDTIEELAAEGFITSFGGGGVENIAEWAESDDAIYTTLAEVLDMSHDIVEMENGERLYVWPAAFKYDSWDEIPDHLVEELLRIYTQEELDGIALFGSYAGWRAGITESGEWLFFVAGD